MRRFMILALTLVVSASFFSASADGKEKKKKKKEQTEQVTPLWPVQLTTEKDSLSYASGFVMSNGLDRFVSQQFGVDLETGKDDFLRGYDEGVNDTTEQALKAYAAGILIAAMTRDNNFEKMKAQFGSGFRCDLLMRGLRDVLTGDTAIFTSASAQQFQKAFSERRAAEVRKENEEFLLKNGTKPGVVTTESGLQYHVLREGTGDIPKASDEVVVRYEGRLIDGTVFDSSENHGPDGVTFRADRLIKGWTEALTQMKVGSKWEIFVPQQLGYGSRPSGKIPAYSTLIFKLELLDIKKKNQ